MKNCTIPLVLASLISGTCLAQQTQLQIDRSAGPARLTVQGETNRDYTLVATDLASSNWDFLATLTLTNSSQPWFDSASVTKSSRFYRALKLDSSTPSENADDFR